MNQKRLAVHIQNDDLFGTLATIIDLLWQDAAHGYGSKHERVLRQIRDDLNYLQDHCRLSTRAPAIPHTRK